MNQLCDCGFPECVRASGQLLRPTETIIPTPTKMMFASLPRMRPLVTILPHPLTAELLSRYWWWSLAKILMIAEEHCPGVEAVSDAYQWHDSCLRLEASRICAVCLRRPRHRFVSDHDKTPQSRGFGMCRSFLCDSCNTGQFPDDRTRLMRWKEYTESWEVAHNFGFGLIPYGKRIAPQILGKVVQFPTQPEQDDKNQLTLFD